MCGARRRNPNLVIPSTLDSHSQSRLAPPLAAVVSRSRLLRPPLPPPPPLVRLLSGARVRSCLRFNAHRVTALQCGIRSSQVYAHHSLQFICSVIFSKRGMNHSESSKIVRGRGRNKRKWTADEDGELVKALCEVSLDPRFKVHGGGFKNCYSLGIENLLAQRLPGHGIKASPHVDSRLKVLKRKFYSIKDMLASPGFSWDGTRKVVQCEKERYDEYCKDNPRAKGMYGIPFPHFDSFDAIYGKDRTAREGMELSEEATADMENGNTSEAGNEEAEEDRMSTGPSGRSVDATSSYKKQKKYKYGGKRKRIESNCPSLDMFKDMHGHYEGAIQHVSTMASAMELFKDVHSHFQSVVQHASAMAAAMETFRDAHDHFQSVIQNVSTAAAAMEQFKDAHDHFQSITQNGNAIAAVMECDADLQERLTSKEPQRNAKVRAIAEMQKLGFTGSEVVNAASIFAKEPNQMDMFLALPEIYKREYVLQMLNGTLSDPRILYGRHLTSLWIISPILA